MTFKNVAVQTFSCLQYVIVGLHTVAKKIIIEYAAKL